MKEFYISDNGIRLHAKLDMPADYQDTKKCPLLIIVHGFTGDMEERHILGIVDMANEMGIAALRVEMYGHGKSDGEFRNHDLFKWISNILTVTDYAKSLHFVSDLYLTGHSQGGLLSILAAGLRPKDYKAVIPLSAALCIPDQARKGTLLGYDFDVENIPDEILVSGKNLLLGGDYMRIAQMIHAEDYISKYHGPVMLIHGDADETVDVQYSIEADQMYEDSSLALIHGDSHCFDYHLEEMLEAFRQFMEKMLG